MAGWLKSQHLARPIRVMSGNGCHLWFAVPPIAREILVGTTGPYVGARQIWDLTLRAPNEDLPELDSFVYAASEWEDRPEDRGVFDEGIAAAARELVNI